MGTALMPKKDSQNSHKTGLQDSLQSQDSLACGTCPKSHYCVNGLEFGRV